MVRVLFGGLLQTFQIICQFCRYLYQRPLGRPEGHPGPARCASPKSTPEPMTRTLLLIILAMSWCLTGKAQLSAAFSADRMSGCSPLIIHFVNQTRGSDGAATYRWDLGNGNVVVAANPQAVYTVQGS